VLVTMKRSIDILVRDITDLAKPVTRCVFKACDRFCPSYGPYFMRFVTATRISYVVESVDGDWAMYFADLVSRKTILVRNPGQDSSYIEAFAWSPDGSSLAYAESNRWHLRSAGGDVVLGTLGNDLGYNFNPDADSKMVGFSADGQYVVIDQSIDLGTKPAPGGGAYVLKGSLFNVIRLSDKKVVYSRKDGTMATWAGTGAHLYFRVSSGLAEWDPVGGARVVVPGLAWINPVPNADGTRVAFETVNASGNHFAGQVRLADQQLQSFPLSTLPRMNVAFLNPTLVWYAEETPCSGHCPGYGETSAGPPLSGRTYVHDLGTGTISTSADTAVVDSWPHLGSP
jgi:Tol biopolymer transport system component